MDPDARWPALLANLRRALARERCEPELRALLAREQPTAIALAMEELEPDEAQRVFTAPDRECAARALGMLEPELTRSIANMFDDEQFARMIDLMPAALQDVIGFAVFLGLATLLANEI